MLKYSTKMIFVPILLCFCTMELFINQYTICIIQMTKYLKHLASEKLFPSVNSYLLRNTSTLSIYQNLVKVTIIHPPRTNSYLLRNKSALLIYQNLVKVIIVHTSRINSYLLRNTSTLLIYQNLVKVIIIHPKLIQYTNILLRTGNHFSPQIVMFQLTMHYFYGRED